MIPTEYNVDHTYFGKIIREQIILQKKTRRRPEYRTQINKCTRECFKSFENERKMTDYYRSAFCSADPESRYHYSYKQHKLTASANQNQCRQYFFKYDFSTVDGALVTIIDARNNGERKLSFNLSF